MRDQVTPPVREEQRVAGGRDQGGGGRGAAGRGGRRRDLPLATSYLPNTQEKKFELGELLRTKSNCAQPCNYSKRQN